MSGGVESCECPDAYEGAHCEVQKVDFRFQQLLRTSWEGPSKMGLVRIRELGHFMLHLVVTHIEHFIKSNYFCSPSTIG